MSTVTSASTGIAAAIKVLEAHKILMGLNDSNREAFHDLVNALERH